MGIDTYFYNLISTYLISDFVTPLMKIITNLGGEIILIGITLIILLRINNKKIGTAILINLVIATLLNFTIKNIIRRPRPNVNRLIDVSGYSFPSGHSMVSLSFYGFLIYLIIKNIKSKKLKVLLTTIISLLIISIGFSRIYLGVHYTTDVLGGFLVAVIYLTIFIKTYKIVNNEDM